MGNEVWGHIKDIGNIYIDEELVVGTETILFTCENNLHDKYLFMTYDSYECEYVFVKLMKKALIDMLEQRIPIEKVFREAGTIYMTHGDDIMNLEKEEYDADKFSSDKLPEKDVYYTISSKYIKDYIKKLKDEICSDTDYQPYRMYLEREITFTDSEYQVSFCKDDGNEFDTEKDTWRDIGLSIKELIYAA